MNRATITIFLFFLLLFNNSLAAVKAAHPRLYLTDDRMARMRADAISNTIQWQRLKTFVDGDYYSPLNQDIINHALVYKIKQANGDADASTYRDEALRLMWSAIEYGTSTAIDANKLTDSTKDWVDEESVYSSQKLEVIRYYGINPDITQSKIFKMNVAYGKDATFPGSTNTEYYIHPSPATTLTQKMYSPRTEFQASATVGATYVIFPDNPDFIKSRVLGVSVAFDWLYDTLTTEQKNIIVAWLYGTARYMMIETNYGPNNFRWSNYTVDFMCDLTAIAYAIYGWDTTKANEILTWVDSVYNNGVKESFQWILQGGGWSEGDGYGAGIMNRFPEFLEHGYTAEGLDRWADFSSQMKDRLLYTMHMTLPTIRTGTGGVPYREVIANGDGERAKESTYDYLRKACLMVIDHFPNDTMSKVVQNFLSTTTDRNIYPFTAGWEFMFYNSNQEILPISNAPLQNAALNAGMIQMRSGWGSGDTQATFKCGPKLAYHSHLDNTAFTIYKHQDLAPDTGVYPGSGGTVHGNNYFIRTIAHNALLLFDPLENSWTGSIQGSAGTYSNDGGQRTVRIWNADGSLKQAGSWQTTGYKTGSYPYIGHEDIYKMGSITKYDFGDDFVYSVGDATSGYDGNTRKATKVLRKFFYLRPDLFIVYDMVGVKNTSITAKFVLHSVDSLTVNGMGTEIASDAEYRYTDANLIQIDNGKGRLFNKTLVPSSPVIEKIGGRGLRDFWVNGANYSPGSTAYGLWRAEITTPTPLINTEFINVLYATSTSTSSMPASTLFTSTDNQMKGVQIDAPDGKYAVLFSNDDTPQNDITYYVTYGFVTHIIVDLAANTPYYVSASNGNITLTKNQPSGTYTALTSSSAGSVTFQITSEGKVQNRPAPRINNILNN